MKKRNKRERGGQLGFRWKVTELTSAEDLRRWRAERLGQVDAMPEDDPAQVQAKAQAFAEFQQTHEYIQNRLEYDLWTAAFFWHIPKGDAEHMLAPTQQELVMLRSGGSPDTVLVEKVRQMAERLNFFHWELAFPQVFAGDNPGFDCVLGNPPWERIKLQEEEFFAVRDPEIAIAPNKAARQKLINALTDSNPTLAIAFEEAKHAAECSSKFVRQSGRYPLTAVGDINSYALFAELTRSLISKLGRLGIIVPTGIATDDSTKDYFGDLVVKNSLVSLFDFENRETIFLGVHRNYKFSLLTLSKAPIEQVDFVFFATQVEHLKDAVRRFRLSSQDISRFNPNTRTVPVFRTSIDANLTRKIYENSAVLVNVQTGENPWGASFLRMFDMSNDSHLFSDALRQDYSQLYEAKMIEQFEHRWATWVGNDIVDTTLEQLQDPRFRIKTRYWVPESEVRSRIQKYWQRKWFIAFRGITRAVDRRTSWFSVVPYCGVGNSAPVLLVKDSIGVPNIVCLVACFNSFVLDFAARQKVGGINFNFYIVNQLPVLLPEAYTHADIAFIAPRVLELTYTAYDLKPFAEDMGYTGEPFRWDEERRALLRAELDAYYARLYGLTRDELRYILDPQDVYGPDFPGETFRVLKEKEIKQYGEFRTRRLVLEAWNRLEGVEVAGYQGGEQLQVSSDPLPERKAEERIKTVEAISPPKRSQLKTEIPVPVAENPSQPTLINFGLYKCAACGKLVLGFDCENHLNEAHKGKGVEWKKVR